MDPVVYDHKFSFVCDEDLFIYFYHVLVHPITVSIGST